ncbi:hypothetical protein ACED16_02515 [Enterobacter hormaechei]
MQIDKEAILFQLVEIKKGFKELKKAHREQEKAIKAQIDIYEAMLKEASNGE